MSIRATSRLWRRPWAQTIGQRALRSLPQTPAQDPYAFFTKRPRLPAQGSNPTIARFRNAPASRTACPCACTNLAVSENTPLTHRYFFKVYAIDTELDLGAGATKEVVVRAMEEHSLARGRLLGTYQRG